MARDGAVEDASVGEPPGVDDGVQEVGDLGMVTGLADQPRHEVAVAVGEDGDGARQQRVKVAAQGSGCGDVGGLQGELLDGGGRDGGFGRPAPEDRGLGDARALRQLVETKARVAVGGQQLQGGVQDPPVDSRRRRATATATPGAVRLMLG